MESKGGRLQPLSSPSSSPAVCCMCGDRGLSRELFRCKLCVFRSQHKYCSDLYPRADFYRACNWCLREEAGSKLILTEQTTVDRIGSGSSSPVTHSSSAGSGLKLARRAFSPSILNKPVKKQRLGERRLQLPGDSGDGGGGGEELSPASARGRQVFRGKVRRYKLLDEVSS